MILHRGKSVIDSIFFTFHVNYLGILGQVSSGKSGLGQIQTQKKRLNIFAFCFLSRDLFSFNRRGLFLRH